MRNKYITPRERGLIKGALRRVFARSDLRRQCIEASIVRDHKDDSRKRVKVWCKCAVCNELDAKSNMVADHKEPVIPVTSSFEEMSVDEAINRMWCSPENLQPICEKCHNIKTKEENRLRREYKKSKLNKKGK